ncbi:hypothetical protein CTA1_7516 [Colletotrichum tanaceti]|uniref:Uncharacterized protein n=1 Tax=Colletotrichum tanaceti TaxID=1306861 RepID=A0A4U6XAP7_9PEZI|nr:hypothetical protein CTA1_7516 [Colletotrichum tanaceti]
MWMFKGLHLHRLQERPALAALPHLGQRREVGLPGPARSLQLPDVRLRHPEPARPLAAAGALSLPHPDGAARVVQQKHVPPVKVREAGRRAAVLDKVEPELARDVAEPEELLRPVAAGLRLGRRPHRSGTPEPGPGRLVVVVVTVTVTLAVAVAIATAAVAVAVAVAVAAAAEEGHDDARPRLVLGEDLDVNVLGQRHIVDHLRRLGLLHRAAAPPLPLPDLVAGVEHEDVALVQALPPGLDLVHDDAADARRRVLEDAQEGEDRLLGVPLTAAAAGLHVAEPGPDAPRADRDAREQREERVRGRRLQLAVLRRGAAQELVELDRLVGGRAGLVLRGVGAEPEEDVVAQPRRRLLRPLVAVAVVVFVLVLVLVLADLVRVEDDVAVAVQELAVLLRRPRLHLKVLDAPDAQPRLPADPAVVPGRLGGGGLVLDLVVDLGADELDVAVLDVVLLEMHKPLAESVWFRGE